MTVAGDPQPTAPVNLTLESDRYSATSTCTTSGPLELGDGTMTLMVEGNDCPGPTPPALTYDYTLSDDGMTLTISTTYDGVSIVETYTRDAE